MTHRGSVPFLRRNRYHFFGIWGVLFFLLSTFAGQSPLYALSRQEKIAQIDAKIAELEEQKRGFEAKALRQENMADRLQFDDKAYLETRRLLQIAQENRDKAAAIQAEIDRLKAEKRSLGGG